MELNREPGAGDAVAKLMGKAAAHLAQEAETFGGADGFLEARELLGHVVHGVCKIAQLVVAAGQGHGAEVARGDEAGAAFEFLDAVRSSVRLISTARRIEPAPPTTPSTRPGRIASQMASRYCSSG